MLRCKNIGGTLTSPAGNLGVVQLKLILPNLKPEKLTCGEPLQHKSNLLQSPLPSRIAGLKQYKTIKLFTTIILCSVRRIASPPSFSPPPHSCLTPEWRRLSVSRLVIATGPRHSILFACLTGRGVARPLHSCFQFLRAGYLGDSVSGWLLGLCPLLVLLVASVLLVVLSLFSMPLCRFVPSLFRPLFGGWCFWCSLAVALPPFPLPPWPMVVLVRGSVGSPLCCLRLGIWL